MATVKRLLRDIDNKVAAEKKKPEPFESVISKWASEGFDEKTHPYASGSGKGVFHQAKFLHTFDPEEKFDVPVKASFDFGSASKKKAIADLNKRLSGHGIMASVSYPDDDSGNDQIIFSKIPQENKKINPKKVYEGTASARRKQLLGQMEGIRNEEKENERNLLKDFGNNAIPYDEFKKREKQLHQDAQSRVESIHNQLFGNGETAEPAKTKGNEPANINPRQVYENASNAKPRTNSEIIDQSSRDISAELDAQLKNGQISKEEWQEKKANLEAFNRSRNENKDVDYGGLDEEHNRLFEEYMSLDKSYRDISAELDDQVRKGQISTDEWWEKKDKLYDYYTGLKKNKKAEMDSVYAKIKAIDDERERKIQDAKKQKESEALTAKRNQVRAELEKRTGRKYSDDEWATIVELASQLR